MMIAFESMMMNMGDGTRLHVRRHAGSGSDLLCVMIHGFGEGGYVWNDMCELLQQYSLAVVDLRGHGESQRSATGKYDLQTHVADVGQLVSTTASRRIVMIGHSLGGLVTMHIAARLRRIVGAILVDTAPDANSPGTRRAAENLRKNLRVYQSIDDYARQLMLDQPMLAAATAAALAQSALRPCKGGFELRVDPELVHSSTQDNGTAADELNRLLPAISCPTALIRGLASAVVSPTAARRAVAQLRFGSLVTIPAAGHAVMTDNPRCFAEATLAFLGKLSLSATRDRLCRDSSPG